MSNQEIMYFLTGLKNGDIVRDPNEYDSAVFMNIFTSRVDIVGRNRLEKYLNSENRTILYYGLFSTEKPSFNEVQENYGVIYKSKSK